jgi:hypothetical protein
VKLKSICQALALLLLWIGLAPCSARAQAATEAVAPTEATVVPPPELNGQDAIPVRVGIYFLNLVSLNEVEQTFTCTVYITESWKDSRLAFTPKAGESAVRFYRKSDIWFPMLQFDNSASAPTVIGYVMSGRSGGTVRRVEKVTVRLSTSLRLRAFPFDAQNLEVYIHPFSEEVGRIVLEADPDSTGLSSAPYAALPLWDTSQVSYQTVKGVIEKGYGVRSHIVFGLHIIRHSRYYIFRIFLPLFLMVAVSWGVLWIPPADLNSQLLISVTTVLTLVAFSVAISNVLPPVPYLTFYDGFFLASFLFILLTIGEALAVHAMHTNAARARRIRRATRLLLPSSFVLAILIMAFIFLR